MQLNEIEGVIDAYRALEKQIKRLGLERIKAANPKSRFVDYMRLSSFYVDEGKVVAEFDFHEDSPYSGHEEIIFGPEELEG